MYLNTNTKSHGFDIHLGERINSHFSHLLRRTISIYNVAINSATNYIRSKNRKQSVLTLLSAMKEKKDLFYILTFLLFSTF